VSEGYLRGTLSKDALDIDLKLGTASEMQWIHGDTKLFDMVTADGTARTVVETGLKGQMHIGKDGANFNGEVGAEFIALQLAGSLKTDQLNFGDGDFKMDAALNGALNLGAAGGKAKAHVSIEDWKLSIGFHAGADAVIGFNLGLELNVDASQFVERKAKPYVQKAVNTISNPRYNPAANFGGWLGGKCTTGGAIEE